MESWILFRETECFVPPPQKGYNGYLGLLLRSLVKMKTCKAQFLKVSSKDSNSAEFLIILYVLRLVEKTEKAGL